MLTLLNLKLLTSYNCVHVATIVRTLSTSQLKEYYSLLNVTKSSTTKEIKESFLKLSKIYHPDNKDTGSHLKFVQLKQAYDAIKEGPPAVNNSTSSYSSQSPYSNYNEYADLSHKGFRERQQRDFRNRNPYETSNKRYGFGGPYKDSSTPWEDLKREHEYRKAKYSYSSSSSARPLVQITILLSAVGWIFVYSCVLFIWDYNSRVSKGTSRFKPRNYDEYVAYEEYVRRKESERLLRRRRVKSKAEQINSEKVEGDVRHPIEENNNNIQSSS